MLDLVDGQTVVLLGAGASMDACLPSSVRLSGALMDAVIAREKNSTAPLTRTLHAVIDSMIADDAASGKSPNEGIDSERLFTALRLLDQRGDLEVAPFVASWRPLCEEVEDEQPENLGPGSYQVRSPFQGLEYVKADSRFGALAEVMLNDLPSVLSFDPAKVAYLGPLVKAAQRGALIVSLNYDRTVETCAEQNGLTVATGAGQWSGGLEWTWPAASDVRILKLHGSVDWTMSETDSPERSGLDRLVEGQRSGFRGPSVQFRTEGSPALIFGQGNKLRSEGPFMALLFEFEKQIRASKNLIVIGYSFRDAHVNSVIRRWLRDFPDTGLYVIDPDFPEGMISDRDDFKRQVERKIMTGLQAERTNRPNSGILRLTAAEALVGWDAV